MNSHLFKSLPIGALFFYGDAGDDPLPHIKIDSHNARKPSGKIARVNEGVLVFTGYPRRSQPIPVEIPALRAERVS